MPKRARLPRLRIVRGTPVGDAIAGMPDTHLLCRDFGHSWRPWDAQWIPQRRQYQEALLCQRCQTVRRRLLDEYGAQLGQSYTYADGYLVHGVGRLTGDDRNSLRLAGLRAVMRASGDAPGTPPGKETTG
jgi:transposase